MNNTTAGEKLVARIAHLNPCKEATDWLAQQTSAKQAWNDCHDARWMLWLLGKQITSNRWSDDRKPLLACCLEIAETVKHLRQKKSAQKIADAIAVLHQWIDGTADVDAAKKAKSDLYAYAAAAYAATATDAATAADAAADAAATAADATAAAAAAATAAAAAYAAAYATAADAAATAAKTKSLATSADIVRKHFSTTPKIRSH